MTNALYMVTKLIQVFILPPAELSPSQLAISGLEYAWAIANELRNLRSHITDQRSMQALQILWRNNSHALSEGINKVTGARTA